MTMNLLDHEVEAAFLRHKRGELSFAQGVYRSALRRQPDHPAALHYLGLIAQQAGHSRDAVALMRQSIASRPNDPRVHNHLGQILYLLKDDAAAVRSFEQALKIDPLHVDSLNNLANALRTRDLIRAIMLYRRALEANPRASFAAYNLGQALIENGETEEAVKHLQCAIELDPAHCVARHALAILLEQRGDFSSARDHYLAILGIKPDHASALANLLQIGDYAPTPEIVERAESHLRNNEISAEERIKLHHGLGKYYHRKRAFDIAFDHFRKSNDLAAAAKPRFSAVEVSATMEAIRKAFIAEVFGPDQPKGSGSDRPIFIVGLPRSGTTLVEQILASHPHVFGAGELSRIPEIVKYLRPDYPTSISTMAAVDLEELALDYLGLLERLAGPEPVRVTDKLPTNSLNLGLISILFPNARIIYCRRDPRDIAISCFMELFDLDQDYTQNFADFGDYFLLHERQMAHWKETLPTPIHTLRYEDLVADPESAARALVAHCGLDWDPRCLDFTATERAVKTPSRWQVRQPIYTASLGRWRDYAHHMQDLTDKLDAVHYDYHDDRVRISLIDRSAEPAEESRPIHKPVFIVAAPRSGSTLLFETLAESSQITTLGGEAHWLVEEISTFKVGVGARQSNRLDAADATAAVGEHIRRRIGERRIDREGQPHGEEDESIFLEKTPKNALRIPFFDRIFPDARFIYLWRDPRENVSSIMEAWRSGRFVTYPGLPDFPGAWSLLLPPGYRNLAGASLERVAAFQWGETNQIILNDLLKLDRDRWCALEYGDFTADPKWAARKITRFLGVDLDPDLARRVSAPLPQSRYTQTTPAAEKWRVNENAVMSVLPDLEHIWSRLKELRANSTD